MNPIVNNAPLLQYLLESITSRLRKKKHRPPIRVTRGVSPECVRRSRIPKPCPAPCPTEVFEHIVASKIPVTTYIAEQSVTQKIEAEKSMNRTKAKQLLEEANSNKFQAAQAVYERNNVTEKRRKREKMAGKLQQCNIEDLSPQKQKDYSWKASPVPEFYNKKRVNNVKLNATTTLRDATVVYQKHQKEIERIENIIGGGYDPACIEAYQEQLKREEYEESLREIERKHLRGLLTHEEASIARMKLFESNQAKFEKHKKEREKMFDELAEWKKEQNELISEKVNRVHEMELAAIEAKDKLLEQKQERAKQIDEESKRIAAKIADERQAELQRKIDMISEIRWLQSLGGIMEVPKFDPTEGMNFGLLCEMSLAELQERLYLLRVTLADQLQKQKEKIALEKLQRNKLLDDAKLLVETERENQRNKEKSVGKFKLRGNSRDDLCSKSRSKLDEEIADLKAKLMEKRNLKNKLLNTVQYSKV